MKNNKNTRTEHDSIGSIEVAADSLWAAQTQRSLENFAIGNEVMPLELIAAFAQLKRACAAVNHQLHRLKTQQAGAITDACDEILSGHHSDQFPLSVWQTGSGTQTNMNCNEVIAHRANQLLEEVEGAEPVHPNDHVNASQSSNDTFPSAMHIASVFAVEGQLLPAINQLHNTLADKASEFSDIVKVGRTHLQDATPLTLGQEISGWVTMLASSRSQITEALEHLRPLAIGGTAVGTGINAHPDFGVRVAKELSAVTGKVFSSAENKFHALTSHDADVHLSGALKALAANLMKIANDVRWLASGPRCGIGELKIPENEPGSSIMPGKVNPTQAEAMTMVACQVMGNDAAIGFAASQGNFELNVFKPVIAYNLLQSIRLLTDTLTSFDQHCAQGIEPVLETIDHNLNNSLMLVTALNRHIGYDNAAKIAKTAHAENKTLKQAAVELGFLTEKEFDQYVVAKEMVKPEEL